jgi:hypothetical protein
MGVSHKFWKSFSVIGQIHICFLVNEIRIVSIIAHLICLFFTHSPLIPAKIQYGTGTTSILQVLRNTDGDRLYHSSIDVSSCSEHHSYYQ